jgi:hypothetical protein
VAKPVKECKVSRPATPRTALRREAKPEAPPAGPKLLRHGASAMVLLAILVLMWVLEAYLTRAGYLMPLPPMP